MNETTPYFIFLRFALAAHTILGDYGALLAPPGRGAQKISALLFLAFAHLFSLSNTIVDLPRMMSYFLVRSLRHQDTRTHPGREMRITPISILKHTAFAVTRQA